MGFPLVAASGGYSQVSCGARASALQWLLVAEHRLSGAWASVVVVPGLRSTASVVVVPGFSCSATCGIFLDQELNLCLLHWQADS